MGGAAQLIGGSSYAVPGLGQAVAMYSWIRLCYDAGAKYGPSTWGKPKSYKSVLTESYLRKRGVKMKNYYYLLWVDAIVNTKRNNPGRKDWKFSLFTFIALANAMNLFVILLWLKFFNILSFNTEINIFPSAILNNALGFTVYFGSPFMLLNYFFIFHRDRYKKLIKNYSHKNGEFAISYIAFSMLLGFMSIILYGVLT